MDLEFQLCSFQVRPPNSFVSRFGRPDTFRTHPPFLSSGLSIPRSLSSLSSLFLLSSGLLALKRDEREKAFINTSEMNSRMYDVHVTVKTDSYNITRVRHVGMQDASQKKREYGSWFIRRLVCMGNNEKRIFPGAIVNEMKIGRSHNADNIKLYLASRAQFSGLYTHTHIRARNKICISSNKYKTGRLTNKKHREGKKDKKRNESHEVRYINHSRLG